MHVETAAPAHDAPLEVARTRFRRISIAALTALYLIVVSGATVRLTASGLGCEHWPGCTSGNPFPEKDFHAFIEFGNRIAGAITIALTFVAAIAVWVVRGFPRWASWVAVACFVGTLAQAPLGALTVYTDLHPLMVMSHFLLSALVLAAGVVVVIEALRFERGGVGPLVPPRVRWLGLGLAGAGLALVVSGTFVTAAGPHSGGADIRRFGVFSTVLEVHVVTTAAFGIALLAMLVYLARRRSEAPGLFRVGLGVLALVVAQMLVGEAQYRAHLPWGLVLVHVALAAGVWAAVVALAAFLFRPLRSMAPSGA